MRTRVKIAKVLALVAGAAMLLVPVAAAFAAYPDGYTFGFTVRSDSPFKPFNDYIEAARAEPGKINYGSTGTGTFARDKALIEKLGLAAK